MGEPALEVDLVGTRLSLYRVFIREELGELEIAIVDLVKETPKKWVVKPCIATAFTSNIDKELGFLHRTKREALDAFKSEWTDNLSAAHASLKRANSALALVDTMISNEGSKS